MYGSDLTRTHITASALYVPRGLEFRPLPLLREIRLGVWEQLSWGQIQRMDKQMYVDFNKRPDLWRVEGAETFAQVRDRTLEGIRQIAAENPGGTVAAASHGAALRTLLGTLQGMSLEEIGQTGHGDNTENSPSAPPDSAEPKPPAPGCGHTGPPDPEAEYHTAVLTGTTPPSPCWKRRRTIFG